MTATEYTTSDYVILVDENDQEIGTAEKLTAHQNNLLHRAFSIFIFREEETTERLELLLQQRALHKYHSGGLWTNTCCSHPRSGETLIVSAKRRLQEELGIEAPLKKVGSFYYNTHFSNGLSEHEIDHVLVGIVKSQQVITPNSDEVHAYRWVDLDVLQSELETQPHEFTPWFKQALQVVKATVFADDEANEG